MSTDITPLLKGDDEDEVSIEIHGNSLAPPLPSGKLYHVFFSYAESDREFAANLIQRLETELGYKCCDHLRDFVPGWKITDNIKHCVMSSLKTVVLISKESVKSAWCSFEAELTFHMSMDMRKKILIPILVDDCTIPDHLKPLTYIDAREDFSAANWWQKLVDATNQPDEVPIFESDLPSLSSQPYSFNPNFNNLEPLVKIKSKRQTCMREGIVTKTIPNELCCRGIKVPYPVFKEEMENLNKELVFRYHCCCYHRLCWVLCVIPMCCIGIFALFFLAEFAYSCLSQLNQNINECIAGNASPALVTVLAIIFVSSFVLLSIQRNKGELQLSRCFSLMNKRFIQYQIMITFKSYRCTRGFEIDIVYYNYQPCLDYISSAKTQLKLPPVSTGNASEENVTMEDSADEMLTKYSCLYLRQYLDGELCFPSEPRHVRNMICLCQYVEQAENPKAFT